MRRRTYTVALIAAVAVGAFLRFHDIGKLSLWFDEGYTAWAISHRPARIIHLIAADTSPPLYYLLLYGWSVLFGMSEAALRSFSACAAIAAIPLVAAAARRLLNSRPAAAAAAWLVALNFLQTWYAQEARSYELATFLTALLFYAVVRYLAAPKLLWLVVIFVSAAAALYVNNFMAFYVFSIAVAALLLPGQPTLPYRLRRGAILAAALAIIMLPEISVLTHQLKRVNGYFWIDKPNLASISVVIARLAGAQHFWSWDRYLHRLLPHPEYQVPAAVCLILLSGVAACLIFLKNDNRRAAAALCTAALLPILLIAIFSYSSRSIFLWAAFLPSTALFAIVLAAPLAWLAPRAGVPIVAFFLILAAVNQQAYFAERRKEDWRSAAADVRALSPAQKRLLVFVANEAQLPFDYYYQTTPADTQTGAPAGFLDIDPPVTQRRVLSPSDLGALKRQITTGHFDQIVLIESHEAYADPQNLTLGFLIATTHESERIDLPDITIRAFAPR